MLSPWTRGDSWSRMVWAASGPGSERTSEVCGLGTASAGRMSNSEKVAGVAEVGDQSGDLEMEEAEDAGSKFWCTGSVTRRGRILMDCF